MDVGEHRPLSSHPMPLTIQVPWNGTNNRDLIGRVGRQAENAAGSTAALRCVAAVLATDGLSEERNRLVTMNPLIGTWQLVSFEVRDADGRVDAPFGADPVGFITYTADGFMSIHFGRPDRAVLAVNDWRAATDAEIAAAARGYLAYCGTYEVQDGKVVHRVDLSLTPNWMGSELVRRVDVAGETMTLTTPPQLVEGRQRSSTLVWRRLRGSAGSSTPETGATVRI